jgi:hypothetical protein
MGGKAFSNAHVPRMSPAVYQQVSTECQAKLETVFPKVVLPREAPGKADYGDIDFLVEGPTSLEDQVWIKAKEVLGAEFCLSNGNSHSFGVPHPELSDAHVQVDVELSPESGTAEGPELFEWTRFMKGDSDMMQIIGISHRNFGLTCTDKGLFVRLEQIEAYDHKKAKLFLTRDPDQAMDFYGLDKAKYWSGFKDEDDLFDWVTNGRFFSAAVFERREEKHNDRARKVKRPMYSRFLEEYMSAHADKNVSNVWTRQEVLEEALKTFDKQAQYDAMIEEHQFGEDEETLHQQVKTVLPIESKTSKAFAFKALKRWVVFDNGEPKIATESRREKPTEWTRLIAPGRRDDFLEWVKEHWQEAKVLEKQRATVAKETALNG